MLAVAALPGFALRIAVLDGLHAGCVARGAGVAAVGIGNLMVAAAVRVGDVHRGRCRRAALAVIVIDGDGGAVTLVRFATLGHAAQAVGAGIAGEV
ncbi:hypothetical protein GCM10027277_07920 [Pseudoduganella ginsengisoli]